MSSWWAQCLQGAHVLWLQNKHRSPSTTMLDTCYMVFVLMFAFLSLLWSHLSKELCSFGFFRWNFSNRSLAYLFFPTLSNKRSFFLLFLTIMNFSGALLGQTRQPVLASNKSKTRHKLKHTKPFISDSAVMELLAGLHYLHLLATVVAESCTSLKLWECLNTTDLTGYFANTPTFVFHQYWIIERVTHCSSLLIPLICFVVVVTMLHCYVMIQNVKVFKWKLAIDSTFHLILSSFIELVLS